jgi:GMP synthase (glutamine-hydrolysing)
MSPAINKKYIKNFKTVFKGKAKLHFMMWYNKKLLLFIKKNKIDGIILSGSTYRILEDNKGIAKLPKEILKLNIPILGICYGYQWLIKTLCGRDCLGSFKNNKIDFKSRILKINEPFKIKKSYYYFNHYDYICKVPEDWKILIKSRKQIWMAYNKEKKIMGLQFHPEASKIGKVFYRKWLNFIC